jgi:glycosyltransferase involved in cell wall biosynthesis
LLFVLRSKLLIRYSARHAKHVFTVSAYSKKEIISIYSVDEEKISIVPNGVSSDRFYPGTDNSALLSRIGLKPKCYILNVGRLEPRKNLVGLLRAYQLVGAKAIPLVVIGQKDFGYHEAFNLLEDPWLSENVKVISDLADDELPVLYRNALMFVYPSWAEGFGLPPLEAMASGVPVVVSKSTALPEVVGDAGISIDPEDIQGISSAIKALEKNDIYRGELIEKGLRQAASFSWDAAVIRLEDVYRKFG